MANDSATGGYLAISTLPPLPGGLTLTQFIQTLLVGISGLPAALVRPNWQVAPLKAPDLLVDWLAFGVSAYRPDTNAAVSTNEAGVTTLNRTEGIQVECSFYGPLAAEFCAIVRDGFQIHQNQETLRLANMSFVETTPPQVTPDLVHERYVNRLKMDVFLRRQILRTYPILPLVDANGTIETTLGDEEITIDWSSQNRED
jgi:hypothetical protein